MGTNEHTLFTEAGRLLTQARGQAQGIAVYRLYAAELARDEGYMDRLRREYNVIRRERGWDVSAQQLDRYPERWVVPAVHEHTAKLAYGDAVRTMKPGEIALRRAGFTPLPTLTQFIAEQDAEPFDVG